MVLRPAALCLLFAATVSIAQPPSDSGKPKIFHDAALDMTFSYPAAFTAVQQLAESSSAAKETCVKSMLSAGSSGSLGSTAFVISKIDGACPGVLKQALDPASFTKEQIVRQLKNFGTPQLTQEPFRYSIDGHEAAVTMAMAKPEGDGASKKAPTYAAKACFLSDVPREGEKKPKTKSQAPTGQVVCLDFTTQNRELMPTILSFTVGFGVDAPRGIVSGNALR